MRFGYRDYDPGVGRFTAPDPARDKRGDGDLYDYCVDDPVSCVDPAGLAWFLPAAYKGLVAAAEAHPFLFGAGGLAVGSLGGLAVANMASEAIDFGESIRTGEAVTAGRRAMQEINPIALKIIAAGDTPLVVAAGGHSLGPALASAAQRFGPAAAGAAGTAGTAAHIAQRIGASPYGDKIITGITHAAQFAEPFIFPGLPMVPSAPGTIGSVVKAVYDWYQEQNRKSEK